MIYFIIAYLCVILLLMNITIHINKEKIKELEDRIDQINNDKKR